MLKTNLTRSIVIAVGLALLLCVLAVVLREPSAGGYRFVSAFEKEDPEASGQLAEISSVLPLITLYGETGEGPARLILIPGVRWSIPLMWGAPLFHYEVTEDETMTLRPFGKSRSTRFMTKLSKSETTARHQSWKRAREQRAAEFAALVATKATTDGWVSALGNGPATLTLPYDYVYRGGVLQPMDFSDDSHMKFEQAMGRTLPNLARQYRGRYDDFRKTDDGIFIAKQSNGRFDLRAIRTIGGDDWLFGSVANDIDAAKKQLAVIRSLSADGEPWRLVGREADYLHSPIRDRFPDYQGQANTTFTNWTSGVVKPDMIVLEGPFLGRDLSVSSQNAAGGELYNTFQIRLRLLEENGDQTIDDAEILIEAPDQPVQIVTQPGSGYVSSTCKAQGLFPLLPANDGQELALEISQRSASLPDCRLAAQVLIDFGRSDFTADLELAAAAPLSDYFGHFDYMWQGDNDFWTLRRGKSGAVISRTGETVIPVTPGKFFSYLRDDILIGTSNDRDHPGVTLYDLEGQKRLSLDYAALYSVNRPEGLWRDIFQTKKNEKTGLYDLKNRREIAANLYDTVRVNLDWNLVFAKRGEILDLLRPDGSEVIPGGISAYIFANPMRSKPPEDDFLAVKRLSDGNWLFLTRKDIPLLDGIFKDVKRLPRPVTREFELTKRNGEKRYIEVTQREGKVEAIPAPE